MTKGEQVTYKKELVTVTSYFAEKVTYHNYSYKFKKVTSYSYFRACCKAKKPLTILHM